MSLNEIESVKTAIGNLLQRAGTNQLCLPVITAFDPDASRSTNISILSAKFKVDQIEACAEFLDITLADQHENKIYTKATLVPRIVSGFHALLPSTCAECSEMYIVDFEPEEKPLFYCYTCFQGSHCCDSIKKYHQAISELDIPAGHVWLCKKCKEEHNPILPRKSKSRHNSVTKSEHTRSRLQSRSEQSPLAKSEQHAGLTEEQKLELSRKLTEQLNRDDKDETENGSNNLKHSRPSYENLCKPYSQGKCPHGVRGNKKVDGEICPKEHPKKCFRYIKFGSTTKGCKKGSNCGYYHPPLCKFSVRSRKCTNDKCTYPHLKGTVRKNVQQTARASNENTRPKSLQINSETSGNKNHQNHFLELKQLVETMNLKFQEELKMIKASLYPQHYPTMMMNHPTHMRSNMIPVQTPPQPWMVCTPHSSS